MHSIRRSATVNAPLSAVFGYVTDYRTWHEWMLGIKRVDVVGNTATGAGATFECPVTIGAVTIRTRMHIAEWTQDQSVVVESIKGITSRSTWEFTAATSESTVMHIDLAYEVPGGLAGRALGTVLHPFVNTAAGHAEKRVRAQLDGVRHG